MAINLNKNPTMRNIDNPHHVEVHRLVRQAEFNDMLDWCVQSEHPGRFLHYFDDVRRVMRFSFSHENVAFEFKMRWG